MVILRTTRAHLHTPFEICVPRTPNKLNWTRYEWNAQELCYGFHWFDFVTRLCFCAFLQLPLICKWEADEIDATRISEMAIHIAINDLIKASTLAQTESAKLIVWKQIKIVIHSTVFPNRIQVMGAITVESVFGYFPNWNELNWIKLGYLKIICARTWIFPPPQNQERWIDRPRTRFSAAINYVHALLNSEYTHSPRVRYRKIDSFLFLSRP